jgi:hypothetical protein
VTVGVFWIRCGAPTEESGQELFVRREGRRVVFDEVREDDAQLAEHLSLETLEFDAELLAAGEWASRKLAHDDFAVLEIEDVRDSAVVRVRKALCRLQERVVGGLLATFADADEGFGGNEGGVEIVEEVAVDVGSDGDHSLTCL